MNTQHPQLGIDLGRGSIMIAFPPIHSHVPRKMYPTVKIDTTLPDWWKRLGSLIAPDCVIAAEPTGAHALTPIAAAIHLAQPSARIYSVAHTLSASYRAAHLSDAKNDRLDAIALLLIAQDIAAGDPPRAAKLYEPALQSQVEALRTYVNIHSRLTKETTRAKNRLAALAYSLYPSFSKSETWLRAARTGFISPLAVLELAQRLTAGEPFPLYPDGNAKRYLYAIAADLAPLPANPAIVHAIREIIRHHDSTEAQREHIESIIAHLIEQPPFAVVTRRWKTLPGFNVVWAAALHVAANGRTIELKKDEFVAAVGSNPLTHESGSGEKTKTTRKGYRPARAALYMWTLAALGADFAPVRAAYDKHTSIYPARTKLARVLWGVARDASLDSQGE
jgi:hypothetical protein